MYYEEVTKAILGAAYKVHNKLGFGFIEKVYENALVIELKKLDLQVEQQKQIDVFYDGTLVGYYVSDLVVNDLVIVELKAVEFIAKEHEAQLLHYLRASKYEVGLVINFGRSVTVKRKVYENNQKIL